MYEVIIELSVCVWLCNMGSEVNIKLSKLNRDLTLIIL